ncbi:MAG: hypothetical protein ACP5TY_04290 [Thermodesulforhabdaceae bacterium]
MAMEKVSKKQVFKNVVVYGILSAALYVAVFTHSKSILNLCAKGGVYAAIPISMVFVFSFAHGAFANYLWQFLGIDALKKPEARAEKSQEVVKRPAIRRARIQA